MRDRVCMGVDRAAARVLRLEERSLRHIVREYESEN